MIIKVQKTNSFSLYNNLYCKFKVNYNKINNFQKILLFNFVIFNQVFKIRFFFDYNISFAYFKRLFNTFLFLYSFDFVNYFFYSLLKNRCHNVSINKNYILVCNYINNLLYLKLFISYQWITFYILFSLFTFKKKVSLLTFNKRTPVLFVMFKKVQLKMDLSWHTFLLLINKLFSI